jgi:hypothetical protein
VRYALSPYIKQIGFVFKGLIVSLYDVTSRETVTFTVTALRTSHLADAGTPEYDANVGYTYIFGEERSMEN